MSAIYALTIVLLIYAAGDVIAAVTKAKFPSSVARGAIVLIGLWIGLIPKNTFSQSTIGGFGMMAVTLMITMLGTTIDTPEMKRQIKTIIICLAGLAVSTAIILLVGPLLINPQYAYVGSAVYAGGSAVVLMFTSVLKPRGLTAVVGFFTILSMAQSFFGQPVCSHYLRKYAKNFLKDPENVRKWANDGIEEKKDPRLLPGKAQRAAGPNGDSPVLAATAAPLPQRKLLQMPQMLDRVPVTLLKVGLISSLAAFLSNLVGGAIHPFVISIILGWAAVETGFLPKGTLDHTESAGIVTFLAACVLFGNYVGVTPHMFLGYIRPIIVVMVLGIFGTVVTGLLLSRVIKIPASLAIALGLTCTFGFPNTMILTNDVCDALAKNDMEHQALYNVLMPKMLVAGFVTVTITSVFIGSFVLKVFF